METGTKQFRVHRGIRLVGKTFPLDISHRRLTPELIRPNPGKSRLKFKSQHPGARSLNSDNQYVPAYSSLCGQGIHPPVMPRRLVRRSLGDGGSIAKAGPSSEFHIPRSKVVPLAGTILNWIPNGRGFILYQHPDSMSSESLSILAIGTASAELLPGGTFHCEEASTVSSGLERLARGHIDLILLNLNADAEWNLESFAKIHGEFPHLPVIFVTEPAHEETARKGLLLGAQDYLCAPELTAATLASAVRKAVLRHRSQNVSRRDRHLLEILMQKIPDAIYFKDTESRFLRISRAQAKKFNLSDPAAAVGKTDADYFSAAHAQQALADEQETMRTGKPLVDFEEKETWPDGTVTWVSTTKMPLRNRAGEIIGTFGISRDITLRKVAELALAERTTQLQQKNRQIEDELSMARELQLAMLPQKNPTLRTGADPANAVEFFSFFLPSGTVSGDFFDIIKLSDTAIGAFVCDVMGHDVRAALVTAMMRSLVKDMSHAGIDPGQLLGQLNSALAAVFRQTGATMFATAFYVGGGHCRG